MNDNRPREVLVVWTCACGAGHELGFEVKARVHSRTHQCHVCKRILEIWRPRVIDHATPEAGRE